LDIVSLSCYNSNQSLGPQLFQAHDAPGYTPAKIVLLVAVSAVIVFQLILRQVMVAENKRRNAEGNTPREQNAFRDLTDIENREFRYVY